MHQLIPLLLCGAVVTALPNDHVIRKLDPGLRYQYAEDGEGIRLVDLWMKSSDLNVVARYAPDTENVYHVFTRENPSVSQPILLGAENLLMASNFNPQRRTKVLIHGWLESANADFNAVMVPAYLNAEDANVIVVDWYRGAGVANYATAVTNTPISGESVARFITWLNAVTGTALNSYHIVGHGLGGHQAGVVGRNLGGGAAYITALDPSFAGWLTNDYKFQPDDGVYTEVIHTNAGLLGYVATLGQVDFYPNGGIDMPGCLSQECDHARSYFYMAESIQTGGFTGSRCATFITAMAGSCYLWGSLSMGGLEPKTGSMGIYHLRTNIFPPFSRG